jgi:hypothetical protein
MQQNIYPVMDGYMGVIWDSAMDTPSKFVSLRGPTAHLAWQTLFLQSEHWQLVAYGSGENHLSETGRW